MAGGLIKVAAFVVAVLGAAALTYFFYTTVPFAKTLETIHLVGIGAVIALAAFVALYSVTKSHN